MIEAEDEVIVYEELEVRDVKKVSENEIVCEFKHKRLGWIPYTILKDSEEPVQKYLWDKSYKKSLPVAFDIVKDRVVYQALDTASDMVHALSQKYTATEKSMWDLKRVEAEKVKQGQKSELLSVEAKLSNEKTEELADKIIKKSDEYRLAVVTAETIKRNIEKEKNDIKTEKDLNAFVKKYKEVFKDA